MIQKWTRLYKIERVWCDKSQLAAIGLLQTYGIPALPNAVRDVAFGVSTLYSMAKTRRWMNNPSACPRLEEEMKLYSWGRDRKGEQKTRLPEDKHNHGTDAVRYYLTGEGETPEGPLVAVDRTPMYVGPDGHWRDDPRASMARKLEANRDKGLWWDQALDEEDDSVDHANAVRSMLGMALLPDEDDE